MNRPAAPENLRALEPNVEWMNGVQFYLRRDVPMVHGHMIHLDTEWALTSISQVQFWRPEMVEFVIVRLPLGSWG